MTTESTTVWRSHVGIPVRSLWTLLVYAHGLAEFGDRFDGEARDAADLPELLARLLALVVERRLRRDLSRAYQPRFDRLTRVRGSIDLLVTESEQLLRRGRVACSFRQLTTDTPRNRLVRAALERGATEVENAALARSCRRLARELERRGVGGAPPSRAETARDQVARHDAEDRLLVTVARLVLDRILPGELAGASRATALQRDERLLRKIFEAAVAGVYRHHLHGRDGWRVKAQHWLDWRPEAPTAGLLRLLPGMQTDIVLDREDRRLVIDTKFTRLLTRNTQGWDRLKSSHLYQLYAYLRSQEGVDAAADDAAGLLLYPALELQGEVEEAVTLQGHRLRFATVDLAAEPQAWRTRLIQLATS